MKDDGDVECICKCAMIYHQITCSLLFFVFLPFNHECASYPSTLCSVSESVLVILAHLSSFPMPLSLECASYPSILVILRQVKIKSTKPHIEHPRFLSFSILES